MDVREWIARAGAAFSELLSSRIHYYGDSNDERRRTLRHAFSYVGLEEVPGDYLEFGVYKGRTFAYAYHAARNRGLNCRFFAFDSFQGLPEAQGVDAEFERFRGGKLRASLPAFENRLRRSGVERERVFIVPGWFSKTLTAETRERLGLKAASVILIDCDMYASTVPVMEFIAPLLNEGTVLLFDDWFTYRANPKRGEQGAALTWLAGQTRIRLVQWRQFGMHGQGFIVNIVE
jgi:O-methyltransferase